jgi:hypothetical protein
MGGDDRQTDRPDGSVGRGTRSGQAGDKSGARADRLKAALKANMQRRKAARRASAAGESGAGQSGRGAPEEGQDG